MPFSSSVPHVILYRNKSLTRPSLHVPLQLTASCSRSARPQLSVTCSRLSTTSSGETSAYPRVFLIHPFIHYDSCIVTYFTSSFLFFSILSVIFPSNPPLQQPGNCPRLPSPVSTPLHPHSFPSCVIRHASPHPHHLLYSSSYLFFYLTHFISFLLSFLLSFLFSLRLSSIFSFLLSYLLLFLICPLILPLPSPLISPLLSPLISPHRAAWEVFTMQGDTKDFTDTLRCVPYPLLLLIHCVLSNYSRLLTLLLPTRYSSSFTVRCLPTL